MNFDSWAPIQRPMLEYSNYCRVFGASDFSEIFYYGDRESVFADQVAQRFPGELIEHSIHFMSQSEKTDLGDELPPIVTLVESRNLNFENWWTKLRSFLNGSVIVYHDVSEIWLPYFTAKPPMLLNSSYEYSLAYEKSTSADFGIKLPGIGGGFGCYSSASTSFASGTQLSEEEQFQVEVMGLHLIREDKRGRKTESFSPIGVSSSKIVKRSHADYIHYWKKAPLTDFGVPHIHHGADSWLHTDIKRSSKDHFVVNSPLPMSSSLQLSVESETQSSFALKHQIKAGYRYSRKAVGKRAHDIQVEAQPVS